jgi:hypothetical protein
LFGWKDGKNVISLGVRIWFQSGLFTFAPT